jgi:L-serine dehydratase
MRFEALDRQGEALERREYYSVGGGFVINQDKASEDRIVADTTPLPYPFDSGDELLALCRQHVLRIAESDEGGRGIRAASRT